MNRFPPWLGLLLVILIALACTAAWWRHRRWRRRERALRGLLDGADRLEADIKRCRMRLQQAHAAVSVAPQLPVAGSADAGQAIDRALRAVLAHRLWIRDHALTATQAELDAALSAMSEAHAEIRRLLAELGDAQRELDDALREHATP